MLGQSALVSASAGDANHRLFVYEVTGLKQTEQSTNNAYQFRSSANTFIPVPYSRMNQEMQRITRLGGTIVSIRPYEASTDSSEG